VPKAKVEAFFDSLVPSRADELLEKGDELSLREAAELEPRRADIAVRLGQARLERGAEEEALVALKGHADDFVAGGIAARIALKRAGVATEALDALERGDREAALDGLLEAFASLGAAPSNTGNGTGESDADKAETRELLRRAVVGILNEGDPADPSARAYRRRLAAALG
jgi:hypothetical protein